MLVIATTVSKQKYPADIVSTVSKQKYPADIVSTVMSTYSTPAT
jgi:hypothetical protein